MKLSTLGWGLYLWVASTHSMHGQNRQWFCEPPTGFISEYITTMLFTELPDGHPDCSSGEFSGSHADRKWSKRVTKATRDIIERECQLFCAAAGDLIAGDPLRAARDFWFTRNGHGCGFWDGDWDHVPATLPQFNNAGDQLHSLAKSFREVNVYWGRWVTMDDPCWDNRKAGLKLAVAQAEREIKFNRTVNY